MGCDQRAEFGDVWEGSGALLSPGPRGKAGDPRPFPPLCQERCRALHGRAPPPSAHGVTETP